MFIVIKTFADRHTRDLYTEGKSKRFPAEITKRAIRKLEYVDLATGLEDLKLPPSNRLHELERERKGQFAIRVNDQSGQPIPERCFERTSWQITD
jgi:proteic killer suppression protein